MRKALSLLLVSVIAVQAGPVSAQVVAEKTNPPTSDQPTLQERLKNIPVEAERFLESHASKDWAVRYVIQDIPTNTPIEVRLRNGEKAVGRITAVDEEGFTLEQGDYFAYGEVESVRAQLNTTHYKRDFILLGIIVGAVILVTWIVLRQHGG